MTWEGLAQASTIVTLSAGLITLLSVIAYVCTRPKADLRLNEHGVVGVHNTGSNQSIKNIRLGWHILRADGTAHSGTGADPWGQDIPPRTGRWMFLRSSDDPNDLGIGTHDGYTNEIVSAVGEGIIIEFYWQHPFVPWLIQRTIVLSEPTRDLGSQKAVRLSRRKGKKEWAWRVPRPGQEA
ncbi:hypothetical protein SAMN05216488_0064 [Microbacterium sp. LKL04]|uniref:hypothetical protein n=1 Tax=Microbacterium sp. LKL04 TaxID=912630 RepID=UPI000875DCD2|nr:hypothetical protein [Microbacterium sp. LKL04]SCX94120.1 hypothetical protein SAMN05216488_0064 [Microbacterium sp. LKL04]